MPGSSTKRYGKAARVGEIGEAAAHQPLHRNDRVLRIERLHAPAPRSRRRRRARRSARSTAAADGRPRPAARRECRCAPSRPANSSCRDRCRPRACARAAAATRPARRSAAAPSGRASQQSPSASRRCRRRASSRNRSSRTRRPRRVPRGVGVEQRRERAARARARLAAHIGRRSAVERARVACSPRIVRPPRAARAAAPGSRAAARCRSRRTRRRRAATAGMRARHRILQRAVGLVDARRRLQREPLLARRSPPRSGRDALALQRAVGAVERRASKRKRSGKPKSSKWLREKSIIVGSRRAGRQASSAARGCRRTQSRRTLAACESRLRR